MRWLIGTVFLIAFPAFVAYPATITDEQDGVRMTVYAPDWVWQGQHLNLLVVFENTTDRAIELEISRTTVSETAEPSELNVSQPDTLPLEPRSSTRFAFSNIETSNMRAGHSYVFVIRAAPQSSGSPPFELRANFEIEVIRGAVVSEGIWSAILPAAVAAVWCIAFAAYLLRRSKSGAWKTPSAALWDDSAP